MQNRTTLTPEDIARANHILEDHTQSPAVRKRVRAVLLTACGRSAPQIAKQLGIHPDTVRRCRARYFAGGLNALLHDAPRSGRPPDVSKALEPLILAKLREPGPFGCGWSPRALAAELAACYSTVCRALKRMKIRVQRNVAEYQYRHKQQGAEERAARGDELEAQWQTEQARKRAELEREETPEERREFERQMKATEDEWKKINARSRKRRRAG